MKTQFNSTMEEHRGNLEQQRLARLHPGGAGKPDK